MFLVKAGEVEKAESKPLDVKARFQDFEKAKRKAWTLLRSFDQVEIVESRTNECVHFQTRIE